MSKGTPLKTAIANWEKAHDGAQAASAEKVELCGVCPPIERLDAGLATLKSCRHLSLSTNSIDKISNLAGLESLRILSLGRNVIKKLEQLEPVAATLEELWVSYNLLEKLGGLERLGALRVLYASNNKIKDWAEVDRLKALPALEDLLLAGNPLHLDFKDRGALPEYRLEVIKRLPKIKRLDGQLVDPEERELATAGTLSTA